MQCIKTLMGCNILYLAISVTATLSIASKRVKVKHANNTSLWKVLKSELFPWHCGT